MMIFIQRILFITQLAAGHGVERQLLCRRCQLYSIVAGRQAANYSAAKCYAYTSYKCNNVYGNNSIVFLEYEYDIGIVESFNKCIHAISLDSTYCICIKVKQPLTK